MSYSGNFTSPYPIFWLWPNLLGDMVCRSNWSIIGTLPGTSLSAHELTSRSNLGIAVAICAGVEAVVVATVAANGHNIFWHSKNGNEKDSNGYYIGVSHFSFLCFFFFDKIYNEGSGFGFDLLRIINSFIALVETKYSIASSYQFPYASFIFLSVWRLKN